MRLIDRLGEDTAAFHDVTDEDVLRLVGPNTADDYRRYLIQIYGFVSPLERALAKTPDIDRYIDVRGFQKHELLRRDLSAFHMTAGEIERLPQCAVPWFRTPEEALGWAYPIERSTLWHGDLFRHLATVIPGEVAFTSSYLKCYFGLAGEAWNSFGAALDDFGDEPGRARQTIDAAKASFQCLRAWRFLQRGCSHVGRLAHLVKKQLRPGGGPGRFAAGAVARVRHRH
jgi:heme oxygenase